MAFIDNRQKKAPLMFLDDKGALCRNEEIKHGRKESITKSAQLPKLDQGNEGFVENVTILSGNVTVLKMCFFYHLI